MEVKINRINFKKAGCIFITIALMVLIASAVFIFVNFHAQIYDYMNGKTADSYILDSHGPVGEHHDHDKEEFFYIGMNTAQKIGLGVICISGGLLFAAYWILIALCLRRKAERMVREWSCFRHSCSSYSDFQSCGCCRIFHLQGIYCQMSKVRENTE